MRRIKILDSTLREGEQTPGIAFPIHVKIAIAELLDKIGVDIIEAGHPVVSPEIKEAVKAIAGLGLKARIAAHARSLKEDVQRALECGVKFIGIFYCVSDHRLNHYGKSLKEVVQQITDTIRFVKEQAPEVLIRYTPEDTVRSPWKNVVTASTEAAKAGADIISIADTTGFMIPGTERNLYDFIMRLKEEFYRHGVSPAVEVHCHNDRGLALANALDAIRAGAEIIDASVLGLGERAGIVDLACLLTVLTELYEEKKWDLKIIPELYNLVSRYARIQIPFNFPITGRYAFTHCAGVHTQAVIKNPVHYQSLAPEKFGRKTEVALDHMAGLSALKYCLEKIDEPELPEELMRQILAYVKKVGMMGRSVDLEELKLIVNYFKRKISSEVQEVHA